MTSIGDVDGVGKMGAVNAVPQPRLVKAAHEFEGMMMKELLRPMTDGDGLTGDEADGSGGTLGEYASEALGQALSQRGGFGIADRIIGQLSHSGTEGTAKSVAGR